MRFFKRGKTGVLAASVLLTACATQATDPVVTSEVRQITQSSACGLSGPGLAYVDTREDLERLLGATGQNLSTQMIREVDLSREHLVFVTLGEKPTSGHSVALEQARLAGDSLTLEMRVRSPAPDMIVAQVITSPCAVVAVPASGLGRVEVLGVTSQPLARNITD